MNSQTVDSLPSRFELPSFRWVVLFAVFSWVIIDSFKGAGVSLTELAAGIPHMYDLLQEMFPPKFDRVDAIGLALLETFQMAVAGTVLGVVFSFPLAVFATRSLTPNRFLYQGSRFLVSLFRTVPDLIWALLFVVSVGLGPFAGALALMVDTMGFCGRFFAESMEEVEWSPCEGLTAIGAGKLSILFCAVVPSALPSFVNTVLFSLEKATRSSMVLGLVGAGGIGIELKVAMDMFRYDEAATIMLLIFILVIVVEQASSAIRRKVM